MRLFIGRKVLLLKVKLVVNSFSNTNYAGGGGGKGGEGAPPHPSLDTASHT
jgi:hypothetical protein